MHRDAHGFYAILDVDPTSSDQAIRRAFRRRAKELHPDIIPDRAPEFIALKRAYDTLSNPSTRAEYDRACSGAEERRPASASRPPPPSANVAPIRRPTGKISAYAFAFTLMTAITFLFVSLLFSLVGSPPPPSPSIAELAFRERGSKTSETSGTNEQSDTSAGDSGEAARQGSTRFQEEPRSGVGRRSSGYAAPRHSDSEPSW